MYKEIELLRKKCNMKEFFYARSDGSQLRDISLRVKLMKYYKITRSFIVNLNVCMYTDSQKT